MGTQGPTGGVPVFEKICTRVPRFFRASPARLTERATADEPANFLALGNFSMACWLAGRLAGRLALASPLSRLFNYSIPGLD